MGRTRVAIIATVVAAGLLAALAACSAKPGTGIRLPSLPAPEATQESGATCAWRDTTGAPVAKDVGRPLTSVIADKLATMTITTNLGTIEIDMDAKQTPCAVASFAYLGVQKYFDNTSCHRMTNAPTLSVLQCGDPKGDGTGTPGYQYAEEGLNTFYADDKTPAPGKEQNVTYKRGTVAVARTQEPDTSGSQFFFNTVDNTLPASYTPLGTVSVGMPVVDKVMQGGLTPGDSGDPNDGRPKTTITITRLDVRYHS